MRRELYFAEDTIKQTTNINSTFNAGGALTVNAGGDLAVRGAQVTAGGDANLQALGNVAIQSTADTFHQVGASGAERLEATNTAATIQSGGALNVTSGGAARVQGSTLTAANDLTLQATGDVVVESAADEANIKVKGYKKLTTTQKSSELTAGGDVTVGSLVGNLSLISSELQAGGDIALNTPNGTLYLGARKDYVEEHISETKTGSGGMILTMINRGTIDETVVPTLMTANGNIAIVTAGGVIIDYKDTGNLGESIDQLSQAPGLAWMKQVQARGDVQWNAIEELHKSWDYRSQGISPVGAAMISLAVGWATAGMGADLAGLIAEGSTAASGMATGGTLITSSGTLTVANGYTVAALNAGFTSLASQAATAIVGNGGDLGAALKQLGSMDTIKALATSMVTAGLIEGLGVQDGLTTPTTGLEGSALKMTDFANKLKVGIAQASISTTVDSVINGAPLGDNLKNGLVNAVVSVAGAEVANIIGQHAALAGADPTNSAAAVKAAQLASHAVLGCGMASATGGDCQSGAMGAVVGELAAEFVDQGMLDGAGAAGTSADAQRTTMLAGQVAAVLAADAAGLDHESASMTAGNAIANNYLTPKEQAERNKLAEECGDTYGCMGTTLFEKTIDADPYFTNDQSADAALDSALVEAANGNGEKLQRILIEFEKQTDPAYVQSALREIRPNWNESQLKIETNRLIDEAYASFAIAPTRMDRAYDQAVNVFVEAAISAGAAKIAKVIYDGGRIAVKTINKIVLAPDKQISPPLSFIDEFADLTDGRSGHIIANHAYGAGKVGKTEFPSAWSNKRIINHVSDIATDPKLMKKYDGRGTPYVIGTRDNVEIRVNFFPDNHSRAGQISTAYPKSP